MTDPIAIDDTTIVWSTPPEELADRPLVVLMHGRGSHEQDLAGLIPLLPQEFDYASLRAPMPFEAGGHTWFAAGAPGVPPLASVDAAVLAVLAWLERVAPRGPIAAAGFSQGGAMATHLMRHAPERFAGYVNLAGFVVPGEAPADARLTELRPPVFWGRGAADPVIPQAAIGLTEQWLASRSQLTTRVYPGLGHSISAEEVDDVSKFLRETLRGGSVG